MLLADDFQSPGSGIGDGCGMRLVYHHCRYYNATHQPDCVKLPSEFFP